MPDLNCLQFLYESMDAFSANPLVDFLFQKFFLPRRTIHAISPATRQPIKHEVNPVRWIYWAHIQNSPLFEAPKLLYSMFCSLPINKEELGAMVISCDSIQAITFQFRVRKLIGVIA